MDVSSDDVRRSTRPGPLRYVTREAWYAARVSSLYATGFSSTVCNLLSKPLPRFSSTARRQSDTRRLPVLMLHGLAHNQSWSVRIQKELHRSGFKTRSMNYQTFGRELDQCADAVAEYIWEYVGASGVPAVHVAAHSIGGIVLRAALCKHEEIRDYVATGVTIGSPHNGTPWAYAPLAHVMPMVGHLVSEIRPGSPTLVDLDRRATPGPTNWVSVYSTTDEVVPAHYGRLDPVALSATQVELSGIGHYGLTYHETSVNAIVDSIENSDSEFAVSWDRALEVAS